MTFLRGVATQAEVVHAVVLRETRTRFGAHKLGYLWALLEPTIVIVTFFWFFRVTHRAPPSGMDLWTFIATGVLPYTLFQSSVTRVADSVNGNKALLYYPQVKPIDLAIARSALEAATFTAVFLVLMFGHCLVTQSCEIDNPLRVVAGLALASALGSSIGLIFCALSQISNIADRVRGPVLRPLFWISGIFFTAESLPEGARDGLLVNPVLHCTELVRDGWFASYSDEHVDVFYVLAFVFGFLLLGLVLERAVRRRIEMQ
jgi:capsular polysaccharide transport system permease protein